MYLSSKNLAKFYKWFSIMFKFAYLISIFTIIREAHFLFFHSAFLSIYSAGVFSGYGGTSESISSLKNYNHQAKTSKGEHKGGGRSKLMHMQNDFRIGFSKKAFSYEYMGISFYISSQYMQNTLGMIWSRSLRFSVVSNWRILNIYYKDNKQPKTSYSVVLVLTLSIIQSIIVGHYSGKSKDIISLIILVYNLINLGIQAERICASNMLLRTVSLSSCENSNFS